MGRASGGASIRDATIIARQGQRRRWHVRLRVHLPGFPEQTDEGTASPGRASAEAPSAERVRGSLLLCVNRRSGRHLHTPVRKRGGYVSQRGGGQLRSESAGATSATVDGREREEVRSGHLPGTAKASNQRPAATRIMPRNIARKPPARHFPPFRLAGVEVDQIE
jgi:hypothetical protein